MWQKADAQESNIGTTISTVAVLMAAIANSKHKLNGNIINN